MNFKQYLLTLEHEVCIVFIKEMSRAQTESGRFALCGVLEVHEDFVLVHAEEDGTPSAVKIEDILCIEPCGISEEEEQEEDVFDKFEKYYRESKEGSE